MQETSTSVTDGQPWAEPPARQHHRVAWRVTRVVFGSALSGALGLLSLGIGALALMLFGDHGSWHALWLPCAGIALWVGSAAGASGALMIRKESGRSTFVPRLATWLLCAPIVWCLFWVVSH